jgi:hypothetical protein
MARKPTAAAAADGQHQAPPASDEIAALRRELAAMSGQLATVSEAYSELKAATGGITLLAPEDTPVYELTQPWYSPDDVYYPAGAQVEDITGEITPNEFMIPLNEAAEARMAEYLQRLPTQGTPSLDHIIQAAMELRPREGDDPRLAAEYHGRVLERAMHLKFKAEGRLPLEAGDRPRAPVRMPARQGAAPIMPNTHIREGDRFGADYRGRFMPGQTRGQRPTATRMRQAAASAAERAAPVLGTVASQPLGTVPAGARV